MKCSNCGKEIPFEGRVCPYCKADKSADRLVHSATSLGMVGGMVAGGLLGSAFGFGEAMISALAGGVVGAVGGVLSVQNKASALKDAQAKQARLADEERIRKDERLRLQERRGGDLASSYSVAGSAGGSATAVLPARASQTADTPPAERDIVASLRGQEQAMLASGDYRKCPFCAEVIKSEARVCRFCNRDIDAR